MSRITAGKAKNINLLVADDVTRPITDRIKISLFDSLQPVINESKCLDLYSGSGAIGLEALSRGAKHVVFVENNLNACNIISQNSLKSGLIDNTRLIEASVEDYLNQKTFEKFDLIFIDPPFILTSSNKLEIVSQSIKLLKSDGYLIFRYPSNEKYPSKIVFNKKQILLVLLKKYGKSTISIYQHGNY